MAKQSAQENNRKKERLTELYRVKRAELKAVIMDKKTSDEDRMEAVFALDALPKNSSEIRVRNRCAVTGRPRGYYRKFGVSRIVLRDLASLGRVPGVIKSSW